jgi:hypothetical protein
VPFHNESHPSMPQRVVNQIEFRAIKRRLDDGRFFWGLFCSDNDYFSRPSRVATDKAAELSRCMGSVSDEAAQSANNSDGGGCICPAADINATGANGLGAKTTASQTKSWHKSGGRARVSSFSMGDWVEA